MAKYKKWKDENGDVDTIQNTETNECIPVGNSIKYEDYLKWVAEGNEADEGDI